VEPDTPPAPTLGEVFYARTFALLALGLLGFLFYQILLPFFAPLAWALFIAFLLHPLHAWLVGKLRGRASLSAALLTFATLLTLIGPLTALGAAFAAQIGDQLRFAQQIAAGRSPSELADLTRVPLLGNLLEWLEQSFGVPPAQIQAWVVAGSRTVLQFLASLGGQIFLGAVGTVLGFVLTMFFLFFAIRDGQQMFTTLHALVPMSAAHKTRLFGHLAAVTRAVFYGSGVTSLVQGTVISIGFAIVGLPSPIVFGVLAALFALVPMTGTPMVWVPAVIVLAAQQRWIAAAFMLAWGAMVATIDNFLNPLLVSGHAHVGTLTVFIGVLGGVSAFGTIGLFLGPLIVALVIALIRFMLDAPSAETRTPTMSEGETRNRQDD
jgi:predicted PurR-regulated permease PerM